jgi:hypothetical protein
MRRHEKKMGEEEDGAYTSPETETTQLAMVSSARRGGDLTRDGERPVEVRTKTLGFGVGCGCGEAPTT